MVRVNECLVRLGSCLCLNGATVFIYVLRTYNCSARQLQIILEVEDVHFKLKLLAPMLCISYSQGLYKWIMHFMSLKGKLTLFQDIILQRTIHPCAIIIKLSYFQYFQITIGNKLFISLKENLLSFHYIV